MSKWEPRLVFGTTLNHAPETAFAEIAYPGGELSEAEVLKVAIDVIVPMLRRI